MRWAIGDGAVPLSVTRLHRQCSSKRTSHWTRGHFHQNTSLSTTEASYPDGPAALADSTANATVKKLLQNSFCPEFGDKKQANPSGRAHSLNA